MADLPNVPKNLLWNKPLIITPKTRKDINLRATTYSFDKNVQRFTFEIQSYDPDFVLDLTGAQIIATLTYTLDKLDGTTSDGSIIDVKGGTVLDATHIAYTVPDQLKGYTGDVVMNISIKLAPDADGNVLQFDLADLEFSCEVSVLDDKSVNIVPNFYFNGYDEAVAQAVKSVKDDVESGAFGQADKNNYGFVKIGDGIKVNNGVISVDGSELSGENFSIDNSGHLILTAGDTKTDLGLVKGADGAPGKDGAPGPAGKDGIIGKNGADGVGIVSSATAYQLGADSVTVPTGQWSDKIVSATDALPFLWTRITLTLSNGNTEVAYAVSGKGAIGPIGPVGPVGGPGPTGPDGRSAYQVWLDAGNTGSETEFLASLKGAQGNQGLGYVLRGKVANVDALPTNAKQNDGYYVEADGCLYIYDGNQWVNVGQFKGDKGNKGDAGTGVVMSNFNKAQEDSNGKTVFDLGMPYTNVATVDVTASDESIMKISVTKAYDPATKMVELTAEFQGTNLMGIANITAKDSSGSVVAEGSYNFERLPYYPINVNRVYTFDKQIIIHNLYPNVAGDYVYPTQLPAGTTLSVSDIASGMWILTATNDNNNKLSDYVISNISIGIHKVLVAVNGVVFDVTNHQTTVNMLKSAQLIASGVGSRPMNHLTDLTQNPFVFYSSEIFDDTNTQATLTLSGGGSTIGSFFLQSGSVADVIQVAGLDLSSLDIASGSKYDPVNNHLSLYRHSLSEEAPTHNFTITLKGAKISGDLTDGKTPVTYTVLGKFSVVGKVSLSDGSDDFNNPSITKTVTNFAGATGIQLTLKYVLNHFYADPKTSGYDGTITFALNGIGQMVMNLHVGPYQGS